MYEMGLACAGMVCAGGAGLGLWSAYEQAARRARLRRVVRALGTSMASRALTSDEGAFARFVLDRAGMISRSRRMGRGPVLARGVLARSRWFDRSSTFAGLRGEVSTEGFCEARMRFALAGCVGGIVCGALVSDALAVLLGLAGLAAGWRCASSAVCRRMAYRACEMERHLPEMLDVVALGMRSGLSFDCSLALYAEHFDSLLSRAFENARQQWLCGLLSRDEALRSIACSYDSSLLGRVVETMVRSLRFGSSMVESLESAARESRMAYRARRQEQVAKAPVKMMVPTGTLILPAMLIMVLGPVLLEMAGGF